MYRITTFGGLSIAREDLPLHGTTVQRRRLALLALLAAAPAQGKTRDKIAALLWPESSEPEARHALRQLLSLVRRDLGEDAVLSGSPELRLNPARISSDLHEFEAAVASRELERAATLYVGPFLDGFFLNGAGEFERWVEEERARLAHLAGTVLETVAEAATQRGDVLAAINWWRRLASLDRLSSRVALKLMQALVAAGDRTAALQHARVHAALLRAELDVEPDGEIQALTRQLQDGPELVARPSAPVAAALPPPPAHQHPRSRAPRTVALVGGAALLLVGAALRIARPHERVTIDPQLIVVAPFRVTSANPSLGYLREGMIDLLTAKLAGDGGPRAVDPRSTLAAWRRHRAPSDLDVTETAAVAIARQLRAGQLLLGAVIESGTEIVLNASLLAVPTGATLVRVEVAGSADSVPVLVDRLAAKLLARRAGEPASRLTSLTSTSLDALRAYLAGEVEYRRGHYLVATQRFGQALQLDSTFAPAALGFAQAAQWTPSSTWDAVLERAWRLRGGLSPADQLLLTAWVGPRGPFRTPQAEVLAARERAVELVPDQPDAWYLLGDAYFHDGAFLGLADSRERAAHAFRRALALDSTFAGPLSHLVILAALRGDTADLQRLGTLYLEQDSTSAVAFYMRWRMATAVKNEALLRRARAGLDSTSADAALRVFSYLWDEPGRDLRDADRALAAYRRVMTTPEQLANYFEARGVVALNRGQPGEAERALDSLAMVPRLGSVRANILRVAAALYWDGDSTAAAAAAGQLERSSQDGALCWVQQWRLAHGLRTGVARAIARLKGGDALCAAVLEAWDATQRGSPRADALLQQLDSVMRSAPFVTLESPDYQNLVLARLFAERNDLPHALAAVRRRQFEVRWNSAFFLTTYLRMEGHLAALAGDRDAALRAYRDYLELRQTPESGVLPVVARVRAEVAQVAQQ